MAGDRVRVRCAGVEGWGPEVRFRVNPESQTEASMPKTQDPGPHAKTSKSKTLHPTPKTQNLKP